MLERLAFGVSDGNTAQTVSTSVGRSLQLAYATVTYSATPVQTGMVATLNSAFGTPPDTTLLTGTANIRYSFIDFEAMKLHPDDRVDILAPAAGGVITSIVAIYGEVVG